MFSVLDGKQNESIKLKIRAKSTFEVVTHHKPFDKWYCVSTVMVTNVT